MASSYLVGAPDEASCMRYEIYVIREKREGDDDAREKVAEEETMAVDGGDGNDDDTSSNLLLLAAARSHVAAAVAFCASTSASSVVVPLSPAPVPRRLSRLEQCTLHRQRRGVDLAGQGRRGRGEAAGRRGETAFRFSEGAPVSAAFGFSFFSSGLLPLVLGSGIGAAVGRRRKTGSARAASSSGLLRGSARRAPPLQLCPPCRDDGHGDGGARC